MPKHGKLYFFDGKYWKLKKAYTGVYTFTQCDSNFKDSGIVKDSKGNIIDWGVAIVTEGNIHLFKEIWK
jgi:hypothetical protein